MSYNKQKLKFRARNRTSFNIRAYRLFLTGCDAPRNVQASSPCSTCVTVHWDRVSSADPDKPVEGYHVTYMASSKTPQTQITNSQIIKINNLQKHTTYRFIVAAVTSEGLGEASPPVTIVTQEDGE